MSNINDPETITQSEVIETARTEAGKEEQQRFGTTDDLVEKESMPDMLDSIWEAEDLGIQGGFMYYYPDGRK